MKFRLEFLRPVGAELMRPRARFVRLAAASNADRAALTPARAVPAGLVDDASEAM